MDPQLSAEEEAIVAQFETLRLPDGDALRQLLPYNATPTLLREIALIDLERRWREFNRRFAKERPPQLTDSLAMLASAGFELDEDESLRGDAFYVVSLWGREEDATRLLQQADASKRSALHEVYASARQERRSVVMRSSDPEAEIDYRELVVERMIGRGGSGRVYLARRKATGEHVAVKSLYKRLQYDPLAMAMFEHEAETLRRFRHPNVVGFQGLGRFPSGGRYLVLDYVDGGTLQQAIQQGACDSRRRQRCFLTIASAVADAHRLGVIHCDLKPQNVLLTRSGDIRIADFGLAQLIEGDSAPFRGGTIGYMPPEQLESGDARQPTIDIYALGGLLYFLTVEQEPQPESLLEIPGDPAMTGVIRRCREGDPRRRYPSVDLLIAELAAINPTAFGTA